MKKFLFAFICICCSVTSTLVYAESPLMIHQTWVREAPPNMMMNAAYMALHNPTDTDIVIVGGSSKDFGSVEVHNTVLDNGVAKMLPVPELIIPAQQSVILAPGGLHIMLLNRQHVVKAGDSIELTLNLKDGQTIPLTIEVKNTLTENPTEEHHQH